MKSAQALELALQYHHSGRLAEAEMLYREILRENPNHHGALHLLGMVAFQMGAKATALELIRRAIDLNPMAADYHNNLGLVWKTEGQLNEAIGAFQRATQIQPDYALAYYNLGLALQQNGDGSSAVAAFRRAIQIEPSAPEAYNDLGNTLKAEGQLEAALAAYRDALKWRPDYAEASYNMALTWRELGDWDQAMASFRDATKFRPQWADAHNQLGDALQKLGRSREAMDCYQQAIALEPQNPWFHTNLGTALADEGRMEEAARAHRVSLKLQPDLPATHYNLSTALLMQGELKEGWPEYEWRTEVTQLNLPTLQVDQPRWDGRELHGEHILLTTEQGLGDIIQFARYVPLVAERGGKVILSGPPILQRLLSNVIGVESWVSLDQELPAFDVHCPLLSLPLVMGTTADTIPAVVPYLFPDRLLADYWRARIPTDNRIKVGLVWAGNPKPSPNRSIALAALAPLGKVPGVWWCSLQKGAGSLQASQAPADLNLVDWTAELNDFADTAALIANLDLVITIDTSVAHLAGALGKPVWVLLMFVPDWRWQLNRTDSPWYPTMRMFRQSKPGDWETPIAQMALALQNLSASR